MPRRRTTNYGMMKRTNFNAFSMNRICVISSRTLVPSKKPSLMRRLFSFTSRE
jgi:hypothetical protein